MTREENLAKRRERFKNRTEEQKERDRRQCRESRARHIDKYREKHKQDYHADPKGFYEKRRSAAQKNPKSHLLIIGRCRAKRLGIEFTITKDDFEIPEYCPILKKKLLSVFVNKEERNFTPSLDRVDNTKGYVPGNVRVISYLANRYKSDLSLEQIKNLYLYSTNMENNSSEH